MEYWPKFIAHHNDAKWLDDDFVALKLNLRRGHVAFVIDFAENYAHKPKFEHQSKYFTQVQTTIVPVVLMLRKRRRREQHFKRRQRTVDRTV